jgi:hypothetical protein
MKLKAIFHKDLYNSMGGFSYINTEDDDFTKMTAIDDKGVRLEIVSVKQTAPYEYEYIAKPIITD